MKITRSQLRKLIMETVETDISVSDGNLKVDKFVYALSSSGVSLVLKSIDKVNNGFKVVITPPKIPFVSDGSDRTGILSGEKLDLIKSKVKSGIGSFDIIMADGTKILFTKV